MKCPVCRLIMGSIVESLFDMRRAGGLDEMSWRTRQFRETGVRPKIPCDGFEKIASVCDLLSAHVAQCPTQGGEIGEAIRSKHAHVYGYLLGGQNGG